MHDVHDAGQHALLSVEKLAIKFEKSLIQLFDSKVMRGNHSIPLNWYEIFEVGVISDDENLLLCDPQSELQLYYLHLQNSSMIFQTERTLTAGKTLTASPFSHRIPMCVVLCWALCGRAESRLICLCTGQRPYHLQAVGVDLKCQKTLSSLLSWTLSYWG